MRDTHTSITVEQWDEILRFVALAVTKNHPKFVKTMRRVMEYVEVAKQDDPVAIARRILEGHTDVGGRSAMR